MTYFIQQFRELYSSNNFKLSKGKPWELLVIYLYIFCKFGSLFSIFDLAILLKVILQLGFSISCFLIAFRNFSEIWHGFLSFKRAFPHLGPQDPMWWIGGMVTASKTAKPVAIVCAACLGVGLAVDDAFTRFHGISPISEMGKSYHGRQAWSLTKDKILNPGKYYPGS